MKKTLRQKIVFALAGFIMAFSTVPSAFAIQAPGFGQKPNENRAEVVQEQKDTRMQLQEENKEKIASRVGAIKGFFNTRAILNKAKITGKGVGSLTVEKDGISYTVNIDDKTKLRRKFFGDATIDEMSVGNLVNIFGKWTDDTHKAIQAVLIRDLSIQKRKGVFVGDVTTVSGNDITITTVHRGIQKATVVSSTKFVDRKEGTLTLADIKVGHRVRIKGMWDSSNNTITEVTQVKDYSLPVKATPTPTLMPTVTPTP
jgi:hypothetical protein